MANDSNLREIGVTGLAQFAGQIQEDFLREMQGREAYKKYSEMRLNSPVIGALLLAVENSVRKAEFSFSSVDEDDPRLDFLEEVQAGMSQSIQEHMLEFLSCLWAGFSLFEIVYQRDKRGRIVWRKFAPRGQDTILRWIFDPEGGLQGVEQAVGATRVILPIEKLILYRTRNERNNPEGRSILRTAWMPYYYCKHIQQIEAIGIERDLAGLPVITLPPGADTADTTTSDYGKASKLVRNVRNDEQAGIVLPSDGWKLELLSTGGSRQFDTDKIIRRYESRMLMSALAQFLMLGQDGVGSLALSRDQSDFFTMSVNAIADIFTQTFTKYALPRMMKLNGLDADGLSLTHTAVGDQDITKLADFLQKVSGLISWNAEDEAWLRQVGGLPERDVDELATQRAEDAAQRAAMAEAIAGRVKQDEQNQQNQEKMTATVFASGALDNTERMKLERRWEKAMKQFLAEQKKRVLKAARELRRG